MECFTRVLSKIAIPPTAAEVRDFLQNEYPGVTLTFKGEPWKSVSIAHADGQDITKIECNPVIAGTLGALEIAEFIAGIRYSRPANAVPWLTDYLRSVAVIYAFRHLPGSRNQGGDAVLRSLINYLWGRGHAIIQADGEGFTNEGAYHILWDFPERASGPWWMAVLQHDVWVRFEMDLGNSEHRTTFLAGKVPAGVISARMR